MARTTPSSASPTAHEFAAWQRDVSASCRRALSKRPQSHAYFLIKSEIPGTACRATLGCAPRSGGTFVKSRASLKTPWPDAWMLSASGCTSAGEIAEVVARFPQARGFNASQGTHRTKDLNDLWH